MHGRVTVGLFTKSFIPSRQGCKFFSSRINPLPVSQLQTLYSKDLIKKIVAMNLGGRETLFI